MLSRVSPPASRLVFCCACESSPTASENVRAIPASAQKPELKDFSIEASTPRLAAARPLPCELTGPI